MGKELAVFAYRLERIAAQVEATEYLGKFSGATGTFSAHVVAAPDVDWPDVSREFVESLGLDLEPAHHPDRVARLAGRALRTRLPRQPHPAQPRDRHLDLHLARLLPADPAGRAPPDRRRCRTRSTRSGSRTPRRTSSCRAALLDSLAATLVTSRAAARPHRLERPSATSASRFGHSLLALDNIAARARRDRPRPQRCCSPTSTATGRCSARRSRRSSAPRSPPAARTIADPYALLKDLTRGKRVGAAELAAFVEGLDIGDAAKQRLLALTPADLHGPRVGARRPALTSGGRTTMRSISTRQDNPESAGTG